MADVAVTRNRIVTINERSPFRDCGPHHRPQTAEAGFTAPDHGSPTRFRGSGFNDPKRRRMLPMRTWSSIDSRNQKRWQLQGPYYDRQGVIDALGVIGLVDAGHIARARHPNPWPMRIGVLAPHLPFTPYRVSPLVLQKEGVPLENRV